MSHRNIVTDHIETWTGSARFICKCKHSGREHDFACVRSDGDVHLVAPCKSPGCTCRLFRCRVGPYKRDYTVNAHIGNSRVGALCGRGR